jgi:hypothetical protein
LRDSTQHNIDAETNNKPDTSHNMANRHGYRDDRNRSRPQLAFYARISLPKRSGTEMKDAQMQTFLS